MKLWQCDECGCTSGLAATTTVRQNQITGEWEITGDIEIDWCDNCEHEKPRATLIDIEKCESQLDLFVSATLG